MDTEAQCHTFIKWSVAVLCKNWTHKLNHSKHVTLNTKCRAPSHFLVAPLQIPWSCAGCQEVHNWDDITGGDEDGLISFILSKSIKKSLVEPIIVCDAGEVFIRWFI